MRTMSLALLLAVALAAQRPPAPPGPPPPDTPKVPVRGRVLDSVTGQPVRGAAVVITAMDRSEIASTSSDAAGRWSMSAVPAGDFPIMASKSGYAENFVSRIVIPASGELSGVDLPINRSAVIGGRVVDAEDRPVVGARVLSLMQRYEAGAMYYEPAGSRFGARSTDDRGEFRIWDLRPGKYLVVATPATEPAASGVIRYAAALTFHPGVATMEDAAVLELGWGEVREGVDIRLENPAATRVDVAVAQGGSSAPCESCRVEVFTDGKLGRIPLPSGQPAQDGGTHIEGLPPGDYLLLARGFDRATGAPLGANGHLQVSEGRPAEVRLEAYPPRMLDVRLVLDDPPEELLGDAAKPWTVVIRQEPPLRDMYLFMRTRETFLRVEGTGRELRGQISVSSGRVRFLVSSQQGHLAAAELDGRPLESAWLDIPEGGLQGELTLHLSTVSGRLEGNVNEELPTVGPGVKPPSTMLILRPANPGKGFLEDVYRPIQPDGSFSVEVPPGIYDAVAIRQGGDLSWRSSDPVLKKAAKRVEIRAGETARVTVDVSN